MKILIVNKFLYPNGGSETYIFELGKELIRQGHEVQYFGMEHPDRVVGNNANAYTTNMDFHGGSKLAKVTAPFKIIYSSEARRQIRKVLENFRPDVVHLNNINFQITPSILYEIKKFDKRIKIISTIHDPQWVCPNHTLINGCTHEGCDKCFGGNYISCVKDNCIHGSKVRSILGAVEAFYYRKRHTYKNVDLIICPSNFMKQTMDVNPDLQGRTVMLRNFIKVDLPSVDEKDVFLREKNLDSKRYALYFGRYSEEKGIRTLIQVAKELPEIQFVFAGTGPSENDVNAVDNIINMGFVTGKNLYSLISGAQFTLIASECYENCPFTVMESTMCGTPIIGAKIGGIPELISAEENMIGGLFKSGDVDDLKQKIIQLWSDEETIAVMKNNCKLYEYDSVDQYVNKYTDLIKAL